MIINDNDVTSKINLILANIPDNFTDIEKLRWVYLKLGQVFCYDFRLILLAPICLRTTLSLLHRYRGLLSHHIRPRLSIAWLPVPP